MDDDVIQQIRALRDGLAAELSRDPRVLTLQSLNKTLAELEMILEPAKAPSAAPAAPAMSLVARLNALAPSQAIPLQSTPPQIARVA